MDPSATSGLAGLGLFIGIFGLILAVLWILVPFAVFGIKGKLERLIAEQRRTNSLIEEYLRLPR